MTLDSSLAPTRVYFDTSDLSYLLSPRRADLRFDRLRALRLLRSHQMVVCISFTHWQEMAGTHSWEAAHEVLRKRPHWFRIALKPSSEIYRSEHFRELQWEIPTAADLELLRGAAGIARDMRGLSRKAAEAEVARRSSAGKQPEKEIRHHRALGMESLRTDSDAELQTRLDPLKLTVETVRTGIGGLEWFGHTLADVQAWASASPGTAWLVPIQQNAPESTRAQPQTNSSQPASALRAALEDFHPQDLQRKVFSSDRFDAEHLAYGVSCDVFTVDGRNFKATAARHRELAAKVFPSNHIASVLDHVSRRHLSPGFDPAALSEHT